MSVKINYKTNLRIKSSSNLILFSDENFNISLLKKHFLSKEYSFILDLLKTRDIKKKIQFFDISSKKKIVLVSLKKNLKAFEAENLGAKFYDQFKDLKQNEYYLNSETVSNQLKNLVGYFLHGLRLKSYSFQKYKSKKNKKNISITVFGKNKPSVKDQLKFKSIEEGTFYTRDLVSEPGNICIQMNIPKEYIHSESLD